MLLKYLLVLCLIGAIQPMRIKRQENGEFWWLKKPQQTEESEVVAKNKDNSEAELPAQVEAEAPVVIEKQISPAGKGIDQNVVKEILSHGPKDAGSSPHPGECVCVPFHLCDNEEIITDGAGIIDIRLTPKRRKESSTKREKRALVGGNCPGSVEVCCRAPRNPNPGPVPHTIDPEPLGPDYIPTCGVRNKDGLNLRITNFKDNESQYGEFPWMVAVLKPTISSKTGKTRDVYQCGGSLIHANVVLTAAHCILGKEPRSLKIRVGEWDTQSEYEFFPHQDRNVIDAVIHEGYNKAALFNDVALLFLETPVDLGPDTDTICLPPPNQIFDGARCFATGWGKDEYGKEGNYQHVLKKIELPMVPNDVCQAKLRTTRLRNRFSLHESFVCAGGEPGKDTCKGDGGSPLVCPVPGTQRPTRYVQVGIVAWGIGCGEQGIPGVYASIPHASQWIQQKVTQRYNLQPNYFSNQLLATPPNIN